MPLRRGDNRHWDVTSIPRDSRDLELRHFDALRNAILNVFRTPVGDRGGIFNPNWGSYSLRWLHEPMDNHTADAIKMTVLHDLERYIPWIRVDPGLTEVRPVSVISDNSGPAYYVRLSIDARPYLSAQSTMEFNLVA